MDICIFLWISFLYLCSFFMLIMTLCISCIQFYIIAFDCQHFFTIVQSSSQQPPQIIQMLIATLPFIITPCMILHLKGLTMQFTKLPRNYEKGGHRHIGMLFHGGAMSAPVWWRPGTYQQPPHGGYWNLTRSCYGGCLININITFLICKCAYILFISC